MGNYHTDVLSRPCGADADVIFNFIGHNQSMSYIVCIDEA